MLGPTECKHQAIHQIQTSFTCPLNSEHALSTNSYGESEMVGGQGASRPLSGRFTIQKGLPHFETHPCVQHFQIATRRAAGLSRTLLLGTDSWGRVLN